MKSWRILNRANPDQRISADEAGKKSAGEPPAGNTSAEKAGGGSGHPYLPTAVLFAVGALLCAAGVWRGDVQVVLAKAIRICMECIGLG